MKNSILVIIIFSVFIFVHSAQATMINYYDFRGTFETTNIGNLESYSIVLNGDYPAILGQFDLNEPAKIQPNKATYIWTGMLQRSFNPTHAELMQRETIEEAWSNYGNGGGFIYGHLLFNGDIFFTANQYYISPIPDLSEYIINDIYTDSFFVQDGPTVDYIIRQWADVTPVPEPSTFILLAIGAAVFGLLKIRGMNKSGLSLP